MGVDNDGALTCSARANCVVRSLSVRKRSSRVHGWRRRSRKPIEMLFLIDALRNRESWARSGGTYKTPAATAAGTDQCSCAVPST